MPEPGTGSSAHATRPPQLSTPPPKWSSTPSPPASSGRRPHPAQEGYGGLERHHGDPRYPVLSLATLVLLAPAVLVAPIWRISPLITFMLSHFTVNALEAVTLRDGLAAVFIVPKPRSPTFRAASIST